MSHNIENIRSKESCLSRQRKTHQKCIEMISMNDEKIHKMMQMKDQTKPPAVSPHCKHKCNSELLLEKIEILTREMLKKNHLEFTYRRPEMAHYRINDTLRLKRSAGSEFGSKESNDNTICTISKKTDSILNAILLSPKSKYTTTQRPIVFTRSVESKERESDRDITRKIASTGRESLRLSSRPDSIHSRFSTKVVPKISANLSIKQSNSLASHIAKKISKRLSIKRSIKKSLISPGAFDNLFGDALKKFSRQEILKSLREVHYYPIYPNPVKPLPTQNEPSLADDESKEFSLCIDYTNLMIDKTNCIRQRTFSGSINYPFGGKLKNHNFYFGNFGFVDGINAESSLINYINQSLDIKKDDKESPEGMSRESFLALSHMFNLKKLLGKSHASGKSVKMSHKRTMLLKPLYSADSDSSSDSNSQSESLDSVDFNLMNQFTQRLAQELKKSNKHISSQIAKKSTTFAKLVNELPILMSDSGGSDEDEEVLEESSLAYEPISRETREDSSDDQSL